MQKLALKAIGIILSFGLSSHVTANDIKNRTLPEFLNSRKLSFAIHSITSGKVLDIPIKYIGSGFPDMKMEISICNNEANVKGIQTLCINKTSDIIKGSDVLADRKINAKIEFSEDDVHLAVTQKFFNLQDYIVKVRLLNYRKYLPNSTIAENEFNLAWLVAQTHESANGVLIKTTGEKESHLELKIDITDQAQANPDLWKTRTLNDLLAHNLLKVELKDLVDTKSKPVGSNEEYFFEAEICTAKIYCMGRISYPFTIDPKTKKVSMAHGLAVFFSAKDVPDKNKFLNISDYNFIITIKRKRFLIDSTVFEQKSPLAAVVVSAKKDKSGALSFGFTTSDGLKGSFSVMPTDIRQKLEPVVGGIDIQAPAGTDLDLSKVPKDILSRIQYGTPNQQKDLVRAYNVAIKILEKSMPKTSEIRPDYLASLTNNAVGIEQTSRAIYKALTTAKFSLPPSDMEDWIECSNGTTLAYVMVTQSSRMSAGDIMLCHILVDRNRNDTYKFGKSTEEKENFFINSYATTLIHEAYHNGVSNYLNSGVSMNECGASFAEYSLSYQSGIKSSRNGYGCPATVERWVNDPRFK